MTEEERMAIYTKLVEKKLSEGGLFDFDGNNCEYCAGWNEAVPECGGWDGTSKRCECGNRRVSWVLSDDNSYVYGEAY